MQTGTVAIDASRLLQSIPSDLGIPLSPAAHPVVVEHQAAATLMRSREAVLQKSDRPRLLLQSALFARGTGASPDGSFAGGADGLWFDRANWAAGVQVVFPNLFDGSSLHARQAAAAADSHVEDARREEALLEVTSQQQSAAAIAEGAIAIAQNTPVQLAAARQSESQARARYEAGLASIVEVAESQGLLAAAEYQDAIARLDVWRALLGQAIASGDLLPFLERVRAAGAP
jgi:outer membrane protein TolC